MKLSFLGAAREVTGSCFMLEADNKKILIDCGLQQGQDVKDDQQLPFDCSDINQVILTHAHIDHSGRLPLLVKNGFRGRIYAIEATCDLVSILLKDSAKIQETDAKLEDKKAKRAGRNKIRPLYSMQDVAETLNHLEPCSYGKKYRLGKNIEFNFIDAGHILGSASAEVFLGSESDSRKIVFSGDIGNIDQPIIKDPCYIEEADLVVMESTYGDRDHKNGGNYIIELAGIIGQTLSKGGNVIIPSFAVGRTQGLLYLIRDIKEKGLIADSSFPVYVDSPLASRATRIYDDDLRTYGDPKTKEIVKKGLNPLDFPNLVFTDSTEDSIALNTDPTPKVIISSSGMCEGGRIRHHLKHNLWRNESSIVFVGFQAYGTLGRELLEGSPSVDIFGEEIAVSASIHNFTGLSAHADREGLLKWINSFKKKPEKVFICHGEDSICGLFADNLKNLGYAAEAPLFRSSYSLADGKLLSPGIELLKKEAALEKADAAAPAYSGLLAAARELSQVAQSKKNAPSRDMETFTRQIEKLIKTWENK